MPSVVLEDSFLADCAMSYLITVVRGNTNYENVSEKKNEQKIVRLSAVLYRRYENYAETRKRISKRSFSTVKLTRSKQYVTDMPVLMIKKYTIKCSQDHLQLSNISLNYSYLK